MIILIRFDQRYNNTVPHLEKRAMDIEMEIDSSLKPLSSDLSAVQSCQHHIGRSRDAGLEIFDHTINHRDPLPPSPSPNLLMNWEGSCSPPPWSLSTNQKKRIHFDNHPIWGLWPKNSRVSQWLAPKQGHGVMKEGNKTWYCLFKKDKKQKQGERRKLCQAV